MKKSFFKTLIVSYLLSCSLHVNADVFDELNLLLGESNKKEEQKVKEDNLVQEVEKKSEENKKDEEVSISSDKEASEEKKPDFQIIDGVYTINNTEEYEKTFLRNVPAGAILISKEDILFQAGRKFLYFDDGEIKHTSPLKESGEVSFCYIKVPLNNSRIMLPKHGYKGLKVSFSEPKKEILSDGAIVYAHRFWFGENNLFDSLTCTTTIADKPLSIADLNKETGDRFKIRFAPVVKAILYE